MTIRQAEISDLKDILPIYAYARQQMAANGNPGQWGADKPIRKAIEHDIKHGNLFLVESKGQLAGVFAFLLGEEPTYRYIEGKWENQLPYGVIRRIAGNGREKGIFKQCLSFCEGFTNNIRIDTHKDNLIMRHLLEKNGFKECGIIYVEDGTPRIAFQRYQKNA